jgi:hypothetical protein
MKLLMEHPVRFVWGVLPTDNGNHFNPGDKGGHIYTYILAYTGWPRYFDPFSKNVIMPLNIVLGA